MQTCGRFPQIALEHGDVILDRSGRRNTNSLSPFMTVRGVRSSWEASLLNWRIWAKEVSSRAIMLLNVSVRRPISSVERSECSRCVRSPAAIRCAATVMESTGRRARPARNHPPTNDDQRDRRHDEQHEKEAAKGFLDAFQGRADLHDVEQRAAVNDGNGHQAQRRFVGISGRFEDGAAGEGGFQRRAAQWHVVLSDIRRADGDRAGRAEDLKEFIDTSQFRELAQQRIFIDEGRKPRVSSDRTAAEAVSCNDSSTWSREAAGCDGIEHHGERPAGSRPAPFRTKE